MSVVALIVILLALAGFYYLVNVKYGGSVAQPFKFLINFVLIVVAVALVLYAFGVWDEVKRVQVPKI